ncbi:MAG: hypothetical protein C4320_08030 [Armatimonadota bacterium]
MRGLVTTEDPAIRTMAWAFVARTGGLDFAKGLLGDADPMRVRAGVGIFGALGSEEGLRLAGTALNSPNRDVRLASLRALAGRVPVVWRARVLELQSDSDALVRRAAAYAVGA